MRPEWADMLAIMKAQVEKRRLSREALELLSTMPLGQGLNGTGLLRLSEILGVLNIPRNQPMNQLVKQLKGILK
jgi:hypothetical protein